MANPGHVALLRNAEILKACVHICDLSLSLKSIFCPPTLGWEGSPQSDWKAGMGQLGVVVYSCNPAVQRQRQEGCESPASLGGTVRPWKERGRGERKERKEKG